MIEGLGGTLSSFPCIARYAAFLGTWEFGEVDQPGIIVVARGGFDEMHD